MPWWGWLLVVWVIAVGLFVLGWSVFMDPLRNRDRDE